MKECPVCRRCYSDDINHCPQDGDETTLSLHGEPTLDARYLLERRLGQGGMGVVFQARHIFLKTAHAIKVILPDLVGNDPMLATRFRQEALAAAAIRHQNIIAVTDFGMVRGTMPFLVMEFVKGKSLQEILALEGPMPPARAWELISAVAAGVGAAHRQGIVHRDLKPLNIMIQEGVPVAEGLKILDFGLAKIKSGELLGSFVQAQTSGLMGSPFYMAPEQWSDDEPDARADIYSLGVILYQLLCGEVPFKGTSIPSIMKKHLTLPPPTFQSKGVTVPPAVEAVVRHALEKECADRIDSIPSFLRELHAAVHSSGSLVTTNTRQTGGLDPNKTIASTLPSTNKPDDLSATNPPSPVTNQTNFGASFDSMAGTVSSTELDEEVQQELSNTAAVHRREKEEQQRRAKAEQEKLQLEELERSRRDLEQREARERERQKKLQLEELEQSRKDIEQREARERQRQEKLRLEELEQSRKDLEQREAREREREEKLRLEELERSRKDIEQREARERERQENERMAVQAKELERLAVSMPPAEVVDVETTRVQQPGAQTQAMGNSYPVQSYTNAIPASVAGTQTKSKNILLVAVAGVVILLLAGAGVGGYLIFKPTSDPVTPVTPTEPPKNRVEMKAIEGGTFVMGSDSGPPQETPEHEVSVQAFVMDRTEVTNSEYAEFVRETNHAVPGYWVGAKPASGQELWPVVSVSFDDANAFAAWRSKRDGVTYRLPTEQEWEYAARNGQQSDNYPWGQGWIENAAVLKEATPSAVGSRINGKNRWGVVDLIGNVWEWTSSRVSAYPGNPVTVPPSSREWLAIRGGCYVSDPKNVDRPVSSAMREFVPPSTKTALLGFRLVRGGS